MSNKYKTAEINGETRITKDGHTMAWFDVLMDLERLERLEKLCHMPRELTAENGAKALLIGEFSESVNMPCYECHDEDPDFQCDECNGAGEFSLGVPVSWTTTKAIYKMAVGGLEIK